MLPGPLGVNSALIAFAIPTLQTADPYNSGFSVMARLIRIPPALVPEPPIFPQKYNFEIRYSAQLLKSFQVFGFRGFKTTFVPLLSFFATSPYMRNSHHNSLLNH